MLIAGMVSPSWIWSTEAVATGFQLNVKQTVYLQATTAGFCMFLRAPFLLWPDEHNINIPLFQVNHAKSSLPDSITSSINSKENNLGRSTNVKIKLSDSITHLTLQRKLKTTAVIIRKPGTSKNQTFVSSIQMVDPFEYCTLWSGLRLI